MILTGTMIAAAAGYIVSAITTSKGGKQAKDEISIEIWNWVKPLFIETDKDFVKELEQNPKDEELQTELKGKIKRLAKNKSDFDKKLAELVKKGSELQTERIKAKGNIEFEAKMKNSKAEVKDIESENGSVNFDIDLS